MAQPESMLEIKGAQVPVHCAQVLVVGSGAAGLNCVEHLCELGVTDVIVITARLGGGTSANAGSDKQTYYKLGVCGDVPDSPLEMARALTAGGMAHGDVAYVEALGSLPEFFHLVRNGVGFPHNRFGAYVGYKTDHDPRQRATSAGPKTSWQMVERSLAQVRRNGTPIVDGHEVIRLLARSEGPWSSPARRIIGLLALDLARLGEEGYGLELFVAPYVVLATGGPGELYRASVYPPGQVGGLGLGLEVGCRANNLTELQFGLASTGFRWNLSGTYQQAIPTYFSTDAAGEDRRYFLNDYFPTMHQQATAIFLKGYQWPFHAQRAVDFGSSLIDIAVLEQTRAGRKVYVDYSHNPVGTPGAGEFSLDNLGLEARTYLERSGALQETPYQRLAHMNPAAVAIFSEHGVDLREPLPVEVCAQHCNGGLSVDIWWQTNVGGLFAVGEVAGTHGVRPGGSALNAGQVGGWRAAQWIAHHPPAGGQCPHPQPDKLAPQVADALDDLEGLLRGSEAAPAVVEVRREIQERMTAHAGVLRSHSGLRQALTEGTRLWERLRSARQRIDEREELVAAIQNEHLCRAHVAILTAMLDYVERGGGSRGGCLVLDDQGDRTVTTPGGSRLRHRSEVLALRGQIQQVQQGAHGTFLIIWEPVRPLPEDDSWFETVWREWRDGTVFEEA